jgi:hypothetical protein
MDTPKAIAPSGPPMAMRALLHPQFAEYFKLQVHTHEVIVSGQMVRPNVASTMARKCSVCNEDISSDWSQRPMSTTLEYLKPPGLQDQRITYI